MTHNGRCWKPGLGLIRTEQIIKERGTIVILYHSPAIGPLHSFSFHKPPLPRKPQISGNDVRSCEHENASYDLSAAWIPTKKDGHGHCGSLQKTQGEWQARTFAEGRTGEKRFGGGDETIQGGYHGLGYGIPLQPVHRPEGSAGTRCIVRAADSVPSTTTLRGSVPKAEEDG